MPNSPAYSKFTLFSAMAVASLAIFACGASEPDYTAEDVRSFHEWRDGEESTPARLIADAAGSGLAVVFAQDDAMRTDSVDLAEALLPALYDAGLREWAVYFLDEASQEEADELILPGSGLGDREAEEEAERLLFAADASMGYADYRDFLLYARDFNGALEDGEEPLRLLALSSGGVPDPGILFPGADSAEEDAEAIPEEDAAPASREEAFGRVIWILAEDLPGFAGEMDGNEIYVAAHALPRDGIVSNESAERDLRDRTFAFEAASPPFGGWNPTPFEESSDLVIVTPFPFETAEPIPGFIDEESSAAAAADFPETRMKLPSARGAARMNRLIRKRPARYARETERSLR